MTEPDPPRESIRSALLMAVLGCAGFLGVLRFGFVYDDRWTLTQNAWLDEPLRALLSLFADGTAVAKDIPDATRPSMVASLWLDRRLFDGSPFGYHLHSLALYAAAVAAALYAARVLAADRVASGFAATFFAVAPLHAEVVCAVNYREDLIAGLGILVPLAWLFRRSTDKDSVRAGVAVAGVFAWGLFGKESAIVLAPLVILLSVLVRVDRVWLEARERTLFLLSSVLVLWLNWRLALTTTDDGIPRAPYSGLWLRLCDTARFELRALGAALVPLRPSPEYAPQGHAGGAWLVALLSVSVSIWYLARREHTRPVALGLAVALVSPIAASPLFRPVNPWADRYLFVAVLGGGLVHGWLATRLHRALSPLSRRALYSAIAISGVVLCSRAALVWQDERSLWTYAVARAPASARAWAALSRVERLSGNLDEADRLIARALAIDPRHVPSRVTRIYNLLARGRVSAARTEIASIERSSKVLPRGLSRARACAMGDAEQARRCIDGGS